MRQPIHRSALVAAILGVAIAFAASGCSNACRALSDQICDCKPNEPEKAACQEQVRLSAVARDQSGNELTEVELAVCEEKLDTCTCEELEDGNLIACGLAKAP